MMELLNFRLSLYNKKFGVIDERVRQTLQANINLGKTFETLNKEIQVTKINA